MKEKCHLVGYNEVVFLFNDCDKMASGAKLYMHHASAIVPMTPQCVGLAEKSVFVTLTFQSCQCDTLCRVTSTDAPCAVFGYDSAHLRTAFRCVRLAEKLLPRPGYWNIVCGFGVKFRQSALEIKLYVTQNLYEV